MWLTWSARFLHWLTSSIPRGIIKMISWKERWRRLVNDWAWLEMIKSRDERKPVLNTLVLPWSQKKKCQAKKDEWNYQEMRMLSFSASRGHCFLNSKPLPLLWVISWFMYSQLSAFCPEFGPPSAFILPHNCPFNLQTIICPIFTEILYCLWNKTHACGPQLSLSSGTNASLRLFYTLNSR